MDMHKDTTYHLLNANASAFVECFLVRPESDIIEWGRGKRMFGHSEEIVIEIERKGGGGGEGGVN